MKDRELKILFKNLDQPKYDDSLDQKLMETLRFAYLKKQKRKERLSLIYIGLAVTFLFGCILVIDHFFYNFIEIGLHSFKQFYSGLKNNVQGVQHLNRDQKIWNLMIFGVGFIGLFLQIVNYYFVRYLNKKNR